MLAAREEQGGGIADLCEPFALHGENADLVHRAKAVLEAAQDAILVAALALEAEHDIDHMLQHARAGDGAILGDMAHQHQRHAIFLGIADEFEGRGAHLADGARRALDLVGMHGLDRIDHQQRGRLHAVQRGENVAHRGGGGQLDRRLGQPQPVGPQAHLPGRFLAADVDRRLTGQGQLDLPMPGSPPIRMALPGTMPPPSARSSSAMPDRRRCSGGVSSSSASNTTGRPPLERLCLLENTVAGASSLSVFHSPQSAHCPCQRKLTLPQAEQT